MRELRAAAAASEELAIGLRKSGHDVNTARSHLDAADRAYGAALTLVPASNRETRLRIELARANLTLLWREAPAAATQLKHLAERARAEGASSELLRDILELQGAASYSIAWSIRRQGGPPAVWRSEAKLASECYRSLAESAKKDRDPGYLRYQKNVETAINLIQVDSPIFDVLAFPGNSPATEDCLKKLKEQRESELRNEAPPPPKSPSPPDDGRKMLQTDDVSDVPASAPK